MRLIIFSLILALFLTACVESGEFDQTRLIQPAELAIVEDPAIAVEKSGELSQARLTSPEDSSAVKIPWRVNLDVPFESQAPLADWGLPYQEACEEAALILAAKYFKNENLDKEIMDAEIRALVEWENENFGYYTDTSLEQVKQMAEEYFDLNAEISADVSIENIKNQLASGKLVLAPTAGRLLGNPYYSGAGPIYHFLVIRGYDTNDFITNDVGTRRGDGYKYRYQTILNSIHDLPLNEDGAIFRPYDENVEDSLKAEKMLAGEKKILIIDK